MSLKGITGNDDDDPVRKVSSQIVIDRLERAYFPAHGAPCTLVTDNATVFHNKLVKDLCFRWGVDHVYTSPYYPQASLAERVNRNLKSALKVFHHKSQNTWDELLPLLTVAFNTATHESSKFTPDVLFLGRELKCPLKSRWDLTSSYEFDKSPTNRSFWSQAYNLRVARNKVANRYNSTRKMHRYKIGDWVLYRKNVASSKARNISAKLMLCWSEPVIIAKMTSTNNVELANPNTGVIVRKAHVSQLKPYCK